MQLEIVAHVAGIFMGIPCYADDVVLIAPFHQAMVGLDLHKLIVLLFSSLDKQLSGFSSSK